jgi:hypothetical protein
VKRIAVLSLVLLLSACHSGGVVPTTGGSGTAATTTSTTEPPRDCLRLAIEAADLLEDMIGALDPMTTAQFEDRSQWSQGLLELEAKGQELDRKEAELGCNRSIIQAAVIDRASGLEARGPVSRFLLGLLLPGD